MLDKTLKTVWSPAAQQAQMQSERESEVQRPGAKADSEDLTREGGRLYVMALLAAAENPSPAEGEGESAWLAVPGGSAALARSLQAALMSRVCAGDPPPLVVAPSSIPGCGAGLFALRDFACGELVLELYGALVPRGKARPAAKDFLFGLNEAFQVDPMHPSVDSAWRVAWAINHSCSPNLVALKSNFRLLGFTSKEAAYMRQPMAPPEGSALHADGEWATSARKDAKVEESGGTNSATRVEKMSSSAELASPDPGENLPQHGAQLHDVGENEERERVGARRAAAACSQDAACSELDEASKDDLIFFVCVHPIKKGEECFFDYNRGAASDGRGKMCRCSSQNCRGVF